MAGHVITANRTKRGKVSGTMFTAHLVGGPELQAALSQLTEKLQTKAAKDAVQAMVDVFVPAWSARAPVEEGTDREGRYRDSIEGQVRKAKTGAQGSVHPGVVEGLEDDEQPRRYAPRLEFGGRAGTAGQEGTRSWVAAQPSARPAFDAVQGAAVEAASAVLRAAAESVHGATPAMPTAGAPATQAWRPGFGRRGGR